MTDWLNPGHGKGKITWGSIAAGTLVCVLLWNVIDHGLASDTAHREQDASMLEQLFKQNCNAQAKLVDIARQQAANQAASVEAGRQQAVALQDLAAITKKGEEQRACIITTQKNIVDRLEDIGEALEQHK